MTDDITIPPKALKAAKRDAAVAIYRLVEPDALAHELTEDEVGEIAHAACLAMLGNWPGMGVDRHWMGAQPKAIILPLTKENTNAEA